MSERLLKILLTDLKTVRVTCTRKQCGWTVEVPLDNLSQVAGSKCYVCGELFDPDQLDTNPLAELQDAVGRLTKLSKRMTVEFVLPAAD